MKRNKKIMAICFAAMMCTTVVGIFIVSNPTATLVANSAPMAIYFKNFAEYIS